MAIYTTDKITINGSSNVFGGFAYAASFAQGFNGSPSNLDLSIIAENRNYHIPDLNFKATYAIKMGNNIALNMYAYRYCIDDNDSGKILRVSFMDDTVRLKRWWIDLKSLIKGKTQVQKTSESSQSTGGLTTNLPSSQTTTTTSTATKDVTIPNVIPLGKTAADLNKNNLPAYLFDHYTYKEFQEATAFLGIPSIPSNDFMTTNMRGTVLDVFNYFMQAYGFSWYMDFSNKIKLVDIKKPVRLDPTLVSRFDNHSKRLSSQMCTDISKNEAVGTLAVDNGGSSDLIVLAGAVPFWNGEFLKIPFKITDVYECIAATLGQEIFFYYVACQRDWKEACQALGFRVREVLPLSDARAATLRHELAHDPGSIYQQSGSETPNDDLGVVIYEPFEDDKEVEFNIAAKIGYLLTRKYYYVLSAFPDVDISWNVGSSQLLDREATIAEAVEFWDTLDFSSVKSMSIRNGSFKDPKTVKLRDIAQSDVWIIVRNPDEVENKPYQQVKPVFSGNLSIAEQPAGIVGIGDSARPTVTTGAMPNPDMTKLGETPKETYTQYLARYAKLQQKALQDAVVDCMTMFPQGTDYLPSMIDRKYDGPTYRMMIINKAKYKKFNVQLPDYSAAKISISGIGRYKDNDTNEIYNASSKVIVAANNPVVTDKTASISISTYENATDETLDTAAFLKQSAFSRSQDDQAYQCEIRGISLGFNITPADGLTDVNISFSDQGYQTSYGLSTRQAEAADIETFRQKFPIN